MQRETQHAKLRLDEAKYITKKRALLTTGQLIKIPSSAFLSHGFFCLQGVSFLLPAHQRPLILDPLLLSALLFFKKKKLGSIIALGFPGHSVVKNPAANAGDVGSIPGSGRSPVEGNGNPLQYSCLENPMDRGAWQV